MSLEQVRIRSTDLALGMYVSQLDRPWSETPFPLQGFLVRTSKDIDYLRNYCDHVFIDLTKGRAPLAGTSKVAAAKPASRRPDDFRPLAGREEGSIKKVASDSIKPIPVDKTIYTSSIPLKVEIRQADLALKTLRGHLILASKQINKGREIDYPGLKSSVDGMVDSVIRCPDAFNWLMRLRAKDQYSHAQSMRCALWAAQFGRFIGMQKEDISILTLGTLLKDVGKIKLPQALLSEHRRTDEQEQQYRRFVDLGADMLKESGVEPRVVSVVKNHCERHDGSGFPRGLMGGKIPLLARIAGIATVYDKISTPRAGGDAMSPSRAVSTLYNMRDKWFQEDLVVQFIQSVGLYPTGTLVELTTGDVGVVVEQNINSRLTPQIALLPGFRASAGGDYVALDLKDEKASRSVMVEKGYHRAAKVPKIAIARDLEFSGHSVDMEAVSRIFMDAAAAQIEQSVAAEPKKKGGFLSKLFSGDGA